MIVHDVMKISISNIAWQPTDDDEVAALLQRCGVKTIDVAPGKYFSDVVSTDTQSIRAVRDYWQSKEISIIGMQALLYGTKGLNLFGPPDNRAAMLKHLQHICRIGNELGAKFLVFGSPRNRDCSGLGPAEAEDIAVDFFRRLGEIATQHDVFICIEPNPVIYGCNFLTHTEEAAAMVRRIGHVRIKLQLDSGTITFNQEPIATTLANVTDVIGHIHASEPNLVTLGEGGADHSSIAEILQQDRPESVVTIEMLPPATGSILGAIDRAISIAENTYGSKSAHP